MLHVYDISWLMVHDATMKRPEFPRALARVSEEEEEGFYKFLPANTADRLCQSWQSCSNHHKI